MTSHHGIYGTPTLSTVFAGILLCADAMHSRSVKSGALASLLLLLLLDHTTVSSWQQLHPVPRHLHHHPSGGPRRTITTTVSAVPWVSWCLRPQTMLKQYHPTEQKGLMMSQLTVASNKSRERNSAIDNIATHVRDGAVVVVVGVPASTSPTCSIRFEVLTSSDNSGASSGGGHAQRPDTKIAQFYKRHYCPVRSRRATQQDHVQCSLWMTTNKLQSTINNSTTISCPEEEILLATVRLCWIRGGNDAFKNRHNRNTDKPGAPVPNASEWIWLRSLCVHTSYRGQGWARCLLQTTLSLLAQLDRCCHQPQQRLPVYCFVKAGRGLGSRLYVPLGFRRIVEPLMEGGTMTVGAAASAAADPTGTTNRTVLPITLRQQYQAVVRRGLSQGDSRAVDLDCYGYFTPDETTIIHQANRTSLPLSPPPSQVNVWILQHERESSRKTGTAQLLLQAKERGLDDDEKGIIPGLNATLLTWSGRSDNQKVDQLLRANLEQSPVGRIHSFVLLWIGGTAELSSFLNATDDEKYYSDDRTTATTKTTPTSVQFPTRYTTSTITFILLDGTWQEAKAMYRKIPALWSLPRLSLVPTHASRYRLRRDYGWKTKFGRPTPGSGRRSTSSANDNDNNKHDDDDDDDDTVATELSLLCTAEVVVELLQQTGNMEGAAAVRRRLDAFMMILRPTARQ